MNKKFIPNFTQYPNEILDEWMPHLSGNQTKIMNVFVRQIYGFHKEYDKISIRQISQKTGIPIGGVFRDMKILIGLGCIRILKQGNKANPHTYEIVNITQVLSERVQSKKPNGVIGARTGCSHSENRGVIVERTDVLSEREQQKKEIYIKEKSERKEQESTEIQLTPNQLAQGFKSTRQIKETIYQYLQSKGIPIFPGADEQAIEKHRLTDPSELIFKIQRLEKLDYLKRNWREWENWIDKTQLPLFQKLELQAGSISWALSNYSTDIDPLYNLIESFIRRREEAERHKRAEREKQEALREENYRKLREQEPVLDAPTKTIIERVQERSKPPEPEEAFQPIVRNFTEEQKARMTELLLKRDRTVEENIELNELMGRRV